MPLESLQNTAESVGLALVSERFPEEREALQRLFRNNPSFQSLCADYRECLESFHRWQESTSEAAPALCIQYTSLLQELEEEVRQYLDEEASSKCNT